MAVRAVAFDVFGTLVHWRSGVADAFRASGVSGDPYELADAWARARRAPGRMNVRRVAIGTQRPRRPRDAARMAICMVLAGVSYALASALAQVLGPRRPD